MLKVVCVNGVGLVKGMSPCFLKSETSTCESGTHTGSVNTLRRVCMESLVGRMGRFVGVTR